MRPVLTLFLISVLLGCGNGPSNGLRPLNFLPQGGTSSPPLPYPAGHYENPLQVTDKEGAIVQSCPDPSVIRGRKPGDDFYYLYCTNERFQDGGYVHLLPIFRSVDLTHWTYVGDVFQKKPSWVAEGGGLWAPDIQFLNGKYYLYYSVSNTNTNVSGRGGAAIFVATSDTPAGPWTASAVPVVEPHVASCCGAQMRATIDSEVVVEGNRSYIFYGSFNGGIAARILSSDGLISDPRSEVQISVADRYEASYVVKRGSYFYLFVSAGDCCAGESSGYGVFVGRSTNVLGPYVDQDSNSFLEARVGGTPVLSMNGNRWVGPGHNAVVTDANGQDWMMYHAIDTDRPYFANGWTRRPLLMDPIDWVDGWPSVRNGVGPSDGVMRSPALAGVPTDPYTIEPSTQDLPGELLFEFSDEFEGDRLSDRWSWLRQPLGTSFSVNNGQLRLNTDRGEIFVGHHDAPVLLQNCPSTDYMVEVKLSMSVPTSGQFNFVQGGMVIYRSDDDYIKLVTSSINNTRQIEFAKQHTAAADGSIQYGRTFLAAPGDVTFLRVARRSGPKGESYTAYSSQDGVNWHKGPTWIHHLGDQAKMGLVSMSGAGFSTFFDYVRVYSLAR